MEPIPVKCDALVHTSAFTGKPESGSLCEQSETWCFIISRDRLNRPLYKIAMVVWCCSSPNQDAAAVSVLNQTLNILGRWL